MGRILGGSRVGFVVAGMFAAINCVLSIGALSDGRGLAYPKSTATDPALALLVTGTTVLDTPLADPDYAFGVLTDMNGRFWQDDGHLVGLHACDAHQRLGTGLAVFYIISTLLCFTNVVITLIGGPAGRGWVGKCALGVNMAIVACCILSFSFGAALYDEEYVCRRLGPLAELVNATAPHGNGTVALETTFPVRMKDMFEVGYSMLLLWINIVFTFVSSVSLVVTTALQDRKKALRVDYQGVPMEPAAALSDALWDSSGGESDEDAEDMASPGPGSPMPPLPDPRQWIGKKGKKKATFAMPDEHAESMEGGDATQ